MKMVDCQICGGECIPVRAHKEIQSISCVKCQLHMMKITGLGGELESDDALIRRWNSSFSPLDLTPLTFDPNIGFKY